MQLDRDTEKMEIFLQEKINFNLKKFKIIKIRFSMFFVNNVEIVIGKIKIMNNFYLYLHKVKLEIKITISQFSYQ